MVKRISKREYDKSRPKEVPDYGFVWIHPDHRESEAEAKRYLKANPTMATNLGDGKGWRYGKDYNFTKEEKIELESTKKKTKKKKRTRGKSINTSGLTYGQKEKKIKALIKKGCGIKLLETVSFERVVMRNGGDKHNPDGLRLLVRIDDLDGIQSNFDYKGKFRIDACISDIKENAEG